MDTMPFYFFLSKDKLNKWKPCCSDNQMKTMVTELELNNLLCQMEVEVVFSYSSGTSQSEVIHVNSLVVKKKNYNNEWINTNFFPWKLTSQFLNTIVKLTKVSNFPNKMLTDCDAPKWREYCVALRYIPWLASWLAAPCDMEGPGSAEIPGGRPGED